MSRYRNLVAAGLAGVAAVATRAAGQSVQYRSPAGVEYRSQPDTGAIARAESALAADPRNVERIIQLGVAQSGARQFREAIETFTRGLAIAPNNPMLYRWRGHRYLSVRELDRAMDDLTARQPSRQHQLRRAVSSGHRALCSRGLQPARPTPSNGRSHALPTRASWPALPTGSGCRSRARTCHRGEGNAGPPSGFAPDDQCLRQRLRLYRGRARPTRSSRPADTSDVAVATLSYGIGNWYLVRGERGDTARARGWFERSVRSGGWPAFGFIISEIELRRLR